LLAQHFGEHTAWFFPMNLRFTISERGLWRPHRKHDMVALPEKCAAGKIDPAAFDLYRRPSSNTVDLLAGLLMHAS